MLQRGAIMSRTPTKYFTEEERAEGRRLAKRAYYLRTKDNVQDFHARLKRETHAIILQYQKDNCLQQLTFDELIKRIMRMAGIIKTDPKLGIPQLKGR